MNEVNTPGPWEVRQKDCVYAGHRLIADCEKTAHANRPAPPNEEDMANARLIAAAPELLEVLEENLRFIPCHCFEKHGDNEACPLLKIELILAKAKGN